MGDKLLSEIEKEINAEQNYSKETFNHVIEETFHIPEKEVSFDGVGRR